MPREEWSHFYKRASWERRRLHQLRIHPLCAFCLQRGLVAAASVVDHVEPHHGDWNKFVFSPLQSLCKSCHDSSKRFIELRGHSIDVDDDGWPTDPRHPANKPR